MPKGEAGCFLWRGRCLTSSRLWISGDGSFSTYRSANIQTPNNCLDKDKEN